MLTKTDFMNYLECPISLWLKTFRPDLLPKEDPAGERILAMGREVDSFARQLFPDGIEINGFHQEGWHNTQAAMRQGAAVLFQPTALAGNLSSRADILVKNGQTDAWDLYEVKMATSLKKEYIFDGGFQAICLAGAGIKLGRIFIVHINKHYVRNGQINPRELFTIQDITQAISEALPVIQDEIVRAEKLMSAKAIESWQLLNLCKKPKTCDYLAQGALAFADISQCAQEIKAKTLLQLLQREVISDQGIDPSILDAIAFEKPDLQIMVNSSGLMHELAKLEYPIYFFDYETYASPLPPFEGLRPYQNIPFQYSLSIQDAPGAPLRHEYFLAETFENPVYGLLQKLRKDIGPQGSVVVWFAPFESTRNEEMALAESEFTEFLRDINERMFDLMLLFKPKNNLYLHSSFKGSASLKVVLPVLCPELSYKDLAIREGATAAASWPLLTHSDLSLQGKQTLRKQMLDYCQRDTDAMAVILDKVIADIKQYDQKHEKEKVGSV